MPSSALLTRKDGMSISISIQTTIVLHGYQGVETGAGEREAVLLRVSGRYFPDAKVTLDEVFEDADNPW